MVLGIINSALAGSYQFPPTPSRLPTPAAASTQRVCLRACGATFSLANTTSHNDHDLTLTSTPCPPSHSLPMSAICCAMAPPHATPLPVPRPHAAPPMPPARLCRPSPTLHTTLLSPPTLPHYVLHYAPTCPMLLRRYHPAVTVTRPLLTLRPFTPSPRPSMPCTSSASSVLNAATVLIAALRSSTPLPC
ncbi:hypothetical protein B0H13DRAFT_2324941 [Mycena leptocephala]|nr:hypothetical protein B0H13DRAFT_2324941 [Mycena leptocephala]